MILSGRFTSIFIITSGLLLGGCATIRDTSTQAVAVTSVPPGATILNAGVPVERTPAIVEVRRNSPNTLSLDSREGPIDLHLARHYRWRGSFWPNFIFVWAAPVGWAIDALSGAAFELTPASAVPLSLTPADRAAYHVRTPTYAIAPARSDEPTFTDAAGGAIEEHLRRQGRRVYPYRETLPTFLKHGYDFDGAPPVAARALLYQRLGADVIVESEVKARGDRLVLETRERPVFGDRVSAADNFNVDAPSGTDRVFTTSRWWSRLLPNTVAIDLAPTRTRLTYDGVSYPLEAPAGASSATQALDYISSLKVTSLPARRLEREARWSLSLVPTIRASRRRLAIPDLPTSNSQDQNTIYDRWLIGAGYGPELGLQVGAQYVYLNALPLVLYSRVGSRVREAGALGLQVSAEIGYLYFLSSKWNLRLFSRSQTENEKVWRRVLDDRLPDPNASLSINNLIAGISVGYRFEPHLRFTRAR